MAGSSSAMGLESQLLSQFTCKVCSAQLRKPRALPCLHSFCEQCLRGMCGDELFVSDITCPTCKQKVSVPGGNISNFPVDFLADRFLSVVMEICPEAKPDQDHIQREKDKNYEMCYGHDKIRDMYCHSCNQVFCVGCSGDHVEHAVGTVKDAAMSAVQNMSSLTNAARDRIPFLQEIIEEIRESIEEVETVHKAAEDQLNHSFEELVASLKSRRKSLLEELHDLRYDRVSVLKMKRNELCATIKKSLELSQTVTEVLEGDTDTNLIYKEEEISEALYRLCNKSFITQEDNVKVEYTYKPRNLQQAIGIVKDLGEIEFKFNEDNGEDEGSGEDEEDEEEDEEILDEEEAKQEIMQELEQQTEIEDVPSKDRETQRPPTTTAEPKSEQLPEQLPEQEHVILAEQHVEGSSENQTEVKQSTVEPRRAAELSENKPATRTETENRAESEDTVPQLERISSTVTSSTRRSLRSGKRSSSTRDSNPCFEVKFSAPDKGTISRYRDISCTPIVELGGKGREEGQLYYPYGVTITQDDNLLVSDQKPALCVTHVVKVSRERDRPEEQLCTCLRFLAQYTILLSIRGPSS